MIHAADSGNTPSIYSCEYNHCLQAVKPNTTLTLQVNTHCSLTCQRASASLVHRVCGRLDKSSTGNKRVNLNAPALQTWDA